MHPLIFFLLPLCFAVLMQPANAATTPEQMLSELPENMRSWVNRSCPRSFGPSLWADCVMRESQAASGGKPSISHLSVQQRDWVKQSCPDSLGPSLTISCLNREMAALENLPLDLESLTRQQKKLLSESCPRSLGPSLFSACMQREMTGLIKPLMKSWKDVIQTSEYKSFNSEEKAAVQEQFFNEVVAPKAGAFVEQARTAFYQAYPLIMSTESVKSISQSEANPLDQFDEQLHKPIDNPSTSKTISYKEYDLLSSTNWVFYIMVLVVVLVNITLSIAFKKISTLISDYYKKQTKKDIFRDLGINEESEENQDVIISYLSERYSSETFKNRLSNLFGLLLTIVGIVVELGLILFFAYLVYENLPSNYSSNRGMLWLPTILYLFYMVAWLCAILLCKLLTNRAPYEAKVFNRSIDFALQQRADMRFKNPSSDK